MKSMKRQKKADTWNKEKGKKRLVNSKKLPPFFRSSRKYGREQCSDFCSGRRKRKVAWDDARENTKRKKERKGGSEWGRWPARTVGIVKNNSDRRSCGSCKHELEHGKTNMALFVCESVIQTDFGEVVNQRKDARESHSDAFKRSARKKSSYCFV